MSMRLKPVIVVPVGLSVTAVALAFLYLHIEGLIQNRMEYQSWIPFSIGLVLAIALGLWPVSRFCSQGSRWIVRSLLFTLFLAPIPYGPEGSLVPALFAMIFPPFVLLFLAPVGPALTFVAMLGLFGSYESIARAARGAVELGASPNGGAAEGVSNSRAGGGSPSVS